MNWRTVLIMVLLGLAEFSLSWLNHKINIFVLARKALEAAKYDLIANSIAEIMPYFIYVVEPRAIYLIPKILMNTLGTLVVASRKFKRATSATPKKQRYKKLPKGITTA